MVLDGHSDLLYDVARRRLAGETRVLERRHLARLRRGGVEGLVLALWTTAEVGTFWTGLPGLGTAAARTALLMDCARAEAAESPWLAPVRTAAEAEEARAAGRIYAFYAVEGMAAIGEDLTGLDRYADFGARIGMLTWNETNALAAGAGGDPAAPLTALGRRAVDRMQALGMVVDVSHLNDGGFWGRDEADPGAGDRLSLQLPGPVRRAAEPDGRPAPGHPGTPAAVVGVNVCHSFVHADPARQTAEMLARHAAHMAEVMGIEHVACGFDFCEFFGPGNEGTKGLGGLRGRSPLFFRCLEALGMTERERVLIARENLLRVLA